MGANAKKLVKGSFLRSFEFFVNAIIGLILMPFIIRSLGDKAYGLWIFIGSLLGYYGLMDFGLHSALQRFVSRASGQEDREEINKIVNTALYIFLAIGLLALILSFIIAFFSPLLFKNIDEVKTFRIVMLILGLNFAIGFPLRVFSGILTADIRFDIRTLVELVKIVIRTLLIIIFLKRGFGLVALATITFFSDIGGYAAIYFLVRKIYPFILLSKTLVDKTKIRALFSYSIHTYASQIAEQLRNNIDSLVIVWYIGLNAVTMYSIGSRLIKYFMEFMTASIGMSMPVFSQYDGRGTYKEMRENFVFLTKIGVFLSLLIGSILIIYGKAFIMRWVGKNYSQAFTILAILLLPSVIEMMQVSSKELLFGLSKHKYFTYANTIEGLFKLILSVILVQKMGLAGVAIGTAVPVLAIKTFVYPAYTCKSAGIKLSYFYLKLMLPSILLSTVISGVYWVIIRSYVSENYFNILAFAVLQAIIFVVIVYKFGFNSQEKEHFRKILLKKGEKIQ